MIQSSRWLLAVFILWHTSSVAAQDWRISPQHPPFPIHHGASLHTLSVEGHEKTEITLIRFFDDRVTIRVLQQPSRETALTLPAALQAAGSFGGTNGGYFELATFGVHGLQISDGTALGTLADSGPRGGALLVRENKIEIVSASTVTDLAGITQMVQCSPFLVEAGKVAFPSGPEDPYAPRTFVAGDGEGGWIIGVSKRNTLGGLASLLASPPLIQGFTVKTALNLDGGPSSGLWCRAPDGRELHRKEGTFVKNIIGLFPRTAPTND